MSRTKVSVSIPLKNIKLDAGQPERYFTSRDGDIIRDLDRRMTRAQLVAHRLVRKRTGKLASSLRKNRGYSKTKPYVDLIAGGRGVGYVMYEHDGTRPHIIRARRKKSLRFVGNGGQVVFRKQVRHPGTTGTHFLTRALPAAGD